MVGSLGGGLSLGSRGTGMAKEEEGRENVYFIEFESKCLSYRSSFQAPTSYQR